MFTHGDLFSPNIRAPKASEEATEVGMPEITITGIVDWAMSGCM
jgi:hypothetical protein